MTRLELNDEYFNWMYQLVSVDTPHPENKSYSKLLHYLYEVDFYYILPMDANRASDGINLRYRFGYEKCYQEPVIAGFLDDRPCSVLEMIFALALRCEEQIMWDPDIGNRLGLWFWDMINSLGLISMDDSKFDAEYTDDVIFRFMDRKYAHDGEGGLFTIKKCKYDLRDIEIWWQLNWHLNEVIKMEGE